MSRVGKNPVNVPSGVTVSIAGAGDAPIKGDGWTLTLKPGWRVTPGSRVVFRFIPRSEGRRSRHQAMAGSMCGS